jgi:hypothetical protein
MVASGESLRRKSAAAIRITWQEISYGFWLEIGYQN